MPLFLSSISSKVMEVLKPSVIWIGNRCYRKNPVLLKEGNLAEEDFEGTL